MYTLLDSNILCLLLDGKTDDGDSSPLIPLSRGQQDIQIASIKLLCSIPSDPFLSSLSLSFFSLFQTPQTPLVRTRFYDECHLDNYPLGTNAIVAVIAYTVRSLIIMIH